MKIMYVLLIIFTLLTGCKFIKNNNIVNTTLQEENNLSDFIYEKPIIIIKNDNKFLQFPNSYIINISENYCKYQIDYIKIYNSNDKESQYNEIKNEDVLLLKLPGNDKWLYCYVSDFIHGYLYVYDISKESFYGNFDENRESGNFYRISLIDEYELINKYSNVKRYGPLLEIKNNHHIIKFWDSFTGENVARGYHYLILDYYDRFNEILIVKQLWEGSIAYIYNILSTDFVCEIEDTPYFNKSRDAVCSFVYGYGDPGVYLKLFLINDGIYKEIINEYISLHYDFSLNGFWINNDEFQIDYIDKYNDYITNDNGSISDVLKEEKGTLLVSRKNPNSAFEIIEK